MSKIRIAGKQNLGCLQCGLCCRRWHVALSDREVRRLRSLRDRFSLTSDPVVNIGGHPFIAHRENGDCIFLDPADNLCMIHKKLGEKRKPLGCRIYPLNIVSTSDGCISVTARMDCPAVQQNSGRPLTSKKDTIAVYTEALQIQSAVSLSHLNGLEPETARKLADIIKYFVANEKQLSPAQVTIAAMFLVETFEKLGHTFLNDTEALPAVLPTLLKKASEHTLEPHFGAVSSWQRTMFRHWLAAYLRRDEEMMLYGTGRRFSRALTLAKMSLGYGDLALLGKEHPAISLRKTGIFGRPPVVSAKDLNQQTWECYYRFLSARLETMQFCGTSYYECDFFSGLKNLIQTFPLVLAAAAAHAAAAGRTITSDDVRYAVGAIDHSFGRSAFLQLSIWRIVERHFTEKRYPRLIAALTSINARQT